MFNILRSLTSVSIALVIILNPFTATRQQSYSSLVHFEKVLTLSFGLSVTPANASSWTATLLSSIQRIIIHDAFIVREYHVHVHILSYS